MTRTADFRPHLVHRDELPDGSILLASQYPLGPVALHTGEWLERWARDAPSRVFLAERSGAGWREVTYAEAFGRALALAAALLGRGLGPNTPILIVAGNSVDHGLLSLAAQWVGIPTAPVAEQYVLIPGALDRLVHAAEALVPSLIFAADGELAADALSHPAFANAEIVASRPAPGQTAFADLVRGGSQSEVALAHAQVGPDTVAKILLTSGSTSAPKGVLTTQRMMCVNQAQLEAALPVLSRRDAPRVLDWLPWNHVFGGSHNFNIMLAHGGSLYIDDGKPTAPAFARTLENLRLVTGTLHFNVPMGFQMLLASLKADQDLARRFFSELDLIFYAGASLPQDVWDGIEGLAERYRGDIPLITSSWGMTETAPSCLVQQEPTERSGRVGVPLPGVLAKLIPDDLGRLELRVKGPNITPGYFRDPERTAAAFDSDGFLVTGDAVTFVDPDDPARGLRFDGRIAEEFKLLSGTWVRAGALRLDVLTALAPIASDVVICGADRSEIGIMVIPHHVALERAGFGDDVREGIMTCPRLRAEIRRRLADFSKDVGSSRRVARAVVMSEPPSLGEGELTAKGNLNASKVLARRSAILDHLYGADSTLVVTIEGALT